MDIQVADSVSKEIYVFTVKVNSFKRSVPACLSGQIDSMDDGESAEVDYDITEDSNYYKASGHVLRWVEMEVIDALENMSDEEIEQEISA